MNEKIKLIGNLQKLWNLIPDCGNYLYCLKISGECTYLKVGMTGEPKRRLRVHKRFLPDKLNGILTDFILSGPYEILKTAEDLLIKECFNKYFLAFNDEIFHFSGFIDEVLPLIPNSCFDEGVILDNPNWVESSVKGYDIDLINKRVRYRLLNKILYETDRYDSKIVTFENGIKSKVENLIKSNSFKDQDFLDFFL